LATGGNPDSPKQKEEQPTNCRLLPFAIGGKCSFYGRLGMKAVAQKKGFSRRN
jgi:hypothetical protein